MTHGSKFHRHAGSNGSASDPSKVFKGKKMPGQMGDVYKRQIIQYCAGICGWYSSGFCGQRD